MSYKLETYTDNALYKLRKNVKRKHFSLEDDLQLQTFYLASIEKICTANMFSCHICYLASRLFQVFFLDSTLEQKNGKSFACACVFIAAKCINKHIQISELTKKILNCNNREILQIEKEILSKTFSILWVPDPLSVLLGLSAYLREHLPNTKVLMFLIENTKKKFFLSIKTDAALLTTTSQLISCLFVLEAQKKGVSLNGLHELDNVFPLVPIVEKYIHNLQIPNKESLGRLCIYLQQNKPQ